MERLQGIATDALVRSTFPNAMATLEFYIEQIIHPHHRGNSIIP